MYDVLDNHDMYNAVLELYQDPDIRDRTFYPQFRRSWDKSFKLALAETDAGKEYFPMDSASVYTMRCTVNGIDFEFHLDQLKMADWFRQESAKHKKIVFVPKRFSRDRQGNIKYQDALCTFDPELPEPALTESIRNIFACAVPGFPAGLQIVYGNKWVSRKFNKFLQRSISLYWVQTDYVPAFLCDAFEVCLYLFLMDYCIIKEDCAKVKDQDLINLLHIMRPSPMLKIKRLLEQ